LAGTVVRNIAAAVDFVNGYPFAGQHVIGGENIGAAGVAAQREHRRMFEQQQRVVDAALMP